MKTCFKCSVKKPLTDFYKHSMMLDGHLNKCKSCTKKDAVNTRNKNLLDPVWVKKEKARQIEKGKRDGNQKRKKYETNYPEKYKAKLVSQRMKPPEVGMVKHHWSYNESHFRDIIWLHPLCHINIHRYIIYDQEQKMYRRATDNVLLNNKEDHISFIKKYFLCCPK